MEIDLRKAIAVAALAASSAVIGAFTYGQVLAMHGSFVEDPYGIVANIAHGEEYAWSYGPNRLKFKCADDAVAAVKQDAGNIKLEFEKCKAALATVFGSEPGLEEPDLFAIFATIVVNRL